MFCKLQTLVKYIRFNSYFGRIIQNNASNQSSVEFTRFVGATLVSLLFVAKINLYCVFSLFVQYCWGRCPSVKVNTIKSAMSLSLQFCYCETTLVFILTLVHIGRFRKAKGICPPFLPLLKMKHMGKQLSRSACIQDKMTCIM